LEVDNKNDIELSEGKTHQSVDQSVGWGHYAVQKGLLYFNFILQFNK